MKIISKSLSSRQRKTSNLTELSQNKTSLGYCCQETITQSLSTTRFTKRNTATTIARQSLKDTSILRSDLDSQLLVKDYKIKLNFKILTLNQIISQMRKEEKVKRSKDKPSFKKQKIEVSLSKVNKAGKGEKKTNRAIPKLIEVQRDHPFLRNFSNKIQQRMEQLLSKDHIYQM